MKVVSISLILLINGLLPLSGQQDSIPKKWTPQWLKKNETFKVDIKAMVQLWSIYSTGFEVFNKQTNTYEQVDNRFNTYLRRARVVFDGEPYPRLKYSVAFFYDMIGRDILTGGIGGTNKADPNAGVWDAFFQYKVLLKSEALNLTAGWFRPQMQRESITSGWAVNSFEKSMSQNYVRNHLVGTGPGRAAGLNIGGLVNGRTLGFNYNIGVFNPVTFGLSGASSGNDFSPLVAGRIVLTIGDSELKKYSISYETNYFGQRKGLSLDFNFATQGNTEQFLSSQAAGPGMLLNYGPINLDAEWIWMQREGKNATADPFKVHSQAGHARLGIDIPAGNYILEPTAMIMRFQGPLAAKEQAEATAVKMSSGNETTYDIGVNWYLDRKNLKLMVHYTFRDGDPGDAGDGATVNQYFSQSGVGAIRRGNWWGLGLGAIF